MSGPGNFLSFFNTKFLEFFIKPSLPPLCNRVDSTCKFLSFMENNIPISEKTISVTCQFSLTELPNASLPTLSKEDFSKEISNR